MSHEEKVEQNRFRFSREITVGDMITALSLLALAFNLWFRVGDHEKRVTVLEQGKVETDRHLGVHDTQIAVLQSYSEHPNETRLIK